MNNIKYNAYIHSLEQLKCVLDYDINKVYIPYDLFFSNQLTHEYITDIHTNTAIKVYISLPEIIRKRDNDYLIDLKDFLLLGKADGVLLKNLEEVGYIYSIKDSLEEQFISLGGKKDGYTPLILEADSSLYNWNKESLAFMYEYFNKATAPCELSIHEIKELDDRDLVIPIYGKTALMVSANCIKKTCGECNKDFYNFDRKIKDRKNITELIYTNCIHCFNKLFNNVPTSFHKQMYDLIKSGFNEFRLDFTDENIEDIKKVLSYYLEDDRAGTFPISEYTTGHILKGAI